MGTLGAGRSYSGACHCGAIGFTYHTARDPTTWPVRACQCSFCRAHQVLSTSDPNGRIELSNPQTEALSRYRFGERTADFLICRDCGVYIGAVIETPRGQFGIVNLRAFGLMPAGLPEPTPMEYGSESREERIARRELRWSPVVWNQP
jgi:hypothetical protein